MRIYRAYVVDGFSSLTDIPEEFLIGYFQSEEEAEDNPLYQRCLAKEEFYSQDEGNTDIYFVSIEEITSKNFNPERDQKYREY